jgi:peptidoglycan/xylan/chitin deacetylase (PgdA/CDA1 family)
MPSIRRLLVPRVFLAGLPRLRELPRVRRLLARTVVVLGYHDLRSAGDVDSWLRVDVASFREHLHLLSSIGTFIQPGQLQNLEELPGVGPRFLITFDDGYPNWLRLGVPVLEESGIPALFFVSSENLLSGQPYWFDRVVLAVQATRTTRLDLRKYGLEDFRFRAGNPSRRWDDIDRLLSGIKRLGDPGSPTVESVLQHLDELGKSAANCDPHCRPMSAAELAQMAGTGTCHFGSHGHRHDILTRLEHGDLLDGVLRSKRTLESITGRPVREFAYPNGDCNDQVILAVREAGYDRGFVTTSGVCEIGTDSYRIPRLLVGGYDSRRRLADQLGAILFGHMTSAIKRRTLS